MKKIIQNGFSLIELLVVVAIIGILAGIAIIGYNNYTESADLAVVQKNAQEISRKIAAEKITLKDFKDLPDIRSDELAGWNSDWGDPYTLSVDYNAMSPSYGDQWMFAQAAVHYALRRAGMKKGSITNAVVDGSDPTGMWCDPGTKGVVMVMGTSAQGGVRPNIFVCYRTGDTENDVVRIKAY